jgi:hypothetical protein
MVRQTIDLHVNPSEEIIRLGPLAVRFLLTGKTRVAALQPLRLLSRADSVWRRRA